jgi:hypothetical protein
VKLRPVEPKPPRDAVPGLTLLPGVDTRLGCTDVRVTVVDEEDRKIGRDQWLLPPEPDDQRDGGHGAAARSRPPCMSVPVMTGAPEARGAIAPPG